MQTRERIHQLVDELPDRELPAVERFLEERRAGDDPVLRALANAPEDDEELTPEEEAAIQEGLDAIERGEVVSSAELRRSLGL
jgi:hypothetical protein